MGFSVSGSAIIVFIGFVVAAGIAVPPLLGSVGDLAGAQGTQIDQGTDRLNTDVGNMSAVYEDGNPGTLTVEVDNTGTTVLSIGKTDLLVDGEIKTESEDGKQTAIVTADGSDPDTVLWLPAETLEITVEADSVPDRIKVVTENGIERAIGGGDIEEQS